MSKRSRKKIPTETAIATVEQLSHEGRGIAHINGKTTFLFGALPEETVEFRYSACHRQYDEGITINVLTASQNRVIPRCKHFGICGGCSLQHLAHDQQRMHKQAMLLEHLSHQAHAIPEEILQPLYGDAFGYRRRARLSVRWVTKKNKVLVGFRERQSSFVADIKQCETLDPTIGHKINLLSELLMQCRIKADIPQIEIAMGDHATALMFRHLVPLPKEDLEKIILFCKTHHFQAYLQPGNEETIHPLYPENPDALFYDIPAENLRLYFKPSQFTQINATINLQMIARAIDLLQLQKTDHVLDLFCCIGNFSLPMAKHCEKVVGVEGSDNAIEQAKFNAAQNHLNNIEFYTHDLEKSLEDAAWAKNHYDKILLDPARTGAKAVLEYIAQWKPKRIVYVSCNPMTLARDAQILIALGYSLKKAGIMDMFPHTEHVEAIALFT